MIVAGSALTAAALATAGLAWADLSLGLGSPNITLTVAPPSSFGMNLVVSPSGQDAYLTEPALDRLLVLDTRTGDVVATVRVGDTPTGLAISPDHRQVWVVDTALAGTTTSAVSVVSTTTNRVVATVRLPEVGAVDLAFSPDGRVAYVTENGITSPGEVDVIDVATRRVVGVIAPRGVGSWQPTSVAVAPDGEVWVSEGGLLGGALTGPGDDLFVFSPTTYALQAEIAVGRGAFFMAMSRDGRFVYVADKESCDLRSVDTSTKRVVALVRTPQTEGCPFGIAAAGQDGVAYFVTGLDHTLRSLDLWREGSAFGTVDFATGRIGALRATGGDPVTLATSAAGGLAYVVDADRPAVYVLEAGTGVIRHTWRVPAGRR